MSLSIWRTSSLPEETAAAKGRSHPTRTPSTPCSTASLEVRPSPWRDWGPRPSRDETVLTLVEAFGRVVARLRKGPALLYAGCGNCGAVVPLWCSGQFMPHMPMPVVATPMGAACQMCGVLPQIFTCGNCWTRQFLVLPGAPAPAQQNLAPVVQAQPNAAPGKVMDLLKVAVDGFSTGAAKQIFG
jgi:hypothetical protein